MARSSIRPLRGTRSFTALACSAARAYPPGMPKGRTVTIQRCARCAHELAARDAHVTCPKCGGMLEILHAPPSARGAALAKRFDARSGSGVWRFRELVMPDAGAHPV